MVVEHAAGRNWIRRRTGDVEYANSAPGNGTEMGHTGRNQGAKYRGVTVGRQHARPGGAAAAPAGNASNGRDRGLARPIVEGPWTRPGRAIGPATRTARPSWNGRRAAARAQRAAARGGGNIQRAELHLQVRNAVAGGKQVDARTSVVRTRHACTERTASGNSAGQVRAWRRSKTGWW